MFINVAADAVPKRDVLEYRHMDQKQYLRMDESDVTTMTYVLGVKMSMKAAKLEFLTCID